MASTVNVPPKDALLLLSPGEVFDMFALWLKQHGIKEDDQ
jgi:hypothetical protein